MRRLPGRTGLATALVALLIGGLVVVYSSGPINRIHLTAYFDNSNGVYVGDDVLIRGVAVGKIEAITPQSERAEVSFWVDGQYRVPADVSAVVISPQLVTARAIQLTPAYSQGPQMADHGVIPQSRTAVPVEWDDVRAQLQKLNDALQPVDTAGVSPLGAFINTAADNLRGQGANMRDTVIELSEVLSTVGDHSGDLYATVRNLSVLVKALHDSADVMSQLNGNLAAVSALVANGRDEVGTMMRDLNTAAADVSAFVADNKETLGTTGDKLSGVTTALIESLYDLKQALHILPTSLANLQNAYEPAHSSNSGAAAINNFSNPLQFICGAVQAASRLGAEESAKLCVQYMAPIFKNRQYNFLPWGLNPLVNAQARPNEVTYSEDWLRPDYVPPAAPPAPESPPPGPAPAATDAPLPAEAPQATDPAAGLTGMMVPPGGGS